MNKCCIFAPIKVYLFLIPYLFMVKECASYYSWSALLVEQRQDISRVLPPPFNYLIINAMSVVCARAMLLLPQVVCAKCGRYCCVPIAAVD